MQTAKLMPALLGAAFLIGTSAWASGTDEASSGGDAAMAAGGQYKEAPMLAAMVAAGELPPVEDRLPIEPNVLVPLEEVGTYGGTLNVFGTGAHPWVDGGDSPERSQYPLRMNFDGSIEPDQARDYELSDDNMTFTLYLREGMKWSNGDDFTAEDFRFKHVRWTWTRGSAPGAIRSSSSRSPRSTTTPCATTFGSPIRGWS